MSGSYHVRLDRLAETVEHLDRLDAHLETMAAVAVRRVDELHLTWTGEAAAAHRVAHQRWLHGVAEMRSGLQQMRSIAATAHGNYSAAVAANVTMWRELL